MFIDNDLDETISVGLKECAQFDDFYRISPLLCNNYKNEGMTFRVIHQNIRSVYKNLDEFLTLLQGINIKFNCIVLTEAWLTEQEPESLPGYNMYRSQDNINQSDGVVVYLDSSLSASCNQLSLGGVATALSITFDWANQPCELLAVYRSPNSDITRFVDGISTYYDGNKSDKYYFRIFTGDTNCNMLNPAPNSIQEKYIDTLLEIGLIPCIDKITRPESKTCIDHFALKIKTFAEITPIVLHTQITDHYSIILDIVKPGNNTFTNKNNDLKK